MKTDNKKRKEKEHKLNGEYWIQLPEVEYSELVTRAAKTNMPIKQWKKEIKELARKALK